MSNNTYQQLIDISDQFTMLLQEETSFLKEHNVPAVQSLLPGKQRLTDLHQQACIEFNAQNQLVQCSPEELNILKEKIDILHNSLIENKEALDIAQTVRSQVIDKISQAVKENQAPRCHYNKTARLNVNTAPVSMLALNRQI